MTTRISRKDRCLGVRLLRLRQVPLPQDAVLPAAKWVHSYKGQTKQAVEFFESKIKDAMLFGDIKRAVASNTDVILFNIDSKADPTAGRDAILAVFLKVLNEMQGYSGDHPHIAHMERYLDSKGKLAAFHAAFRRRPAGLAQRAGCLRVQPGSGCRGPVGRLWARARNRCEKWIDNAESNFP